MLKVIVNACPTRKIKEMASLDSILLTDAEIYKILNEEVEFDLKKYSFNDMESFVDAVVEKSKDKNIIVHTFNPQFLNWFKDDVAKETFFILNERGELKKIFDFEKVNKKLELFGPGEAVSDTDFLKLFESCSEKK